MVRGGNSDERACGCMIGESPCDLARLIVRRDDHNEEVREAGQF